MVYICISFWTLLQLVSLSVEAPASLISADLMAIISKMCSLSQHALLLINYRVSTRDNCNCGKYFDSCKFQYKNAMHIVCTFACNMQNGAPRHSHLQHAFSIKLAPLPQNVANFIHCTAIFQAISFSIRYSILFSCLLFCFLELHIYPGLGRVGQGRADQALLG